MWNFCNFCLKCESEISLNVCAACGTAYYCSKACQKSDWVEHRHHCKGLSKYIHDWILFNSEKIELIAYQAMRNVNASLFAVTVHIKTRPKLHIQKPEICERPPHLNIPNSIAIVITVNRFINQFRHLTLRTLPFMSVSKLMADVNSLSLEEAIRKANVLSKLKEFYHWHMEQSIHFYFYALKTPTVFSCVFTHIIAISFDCQGPTKYELRPKKELNNHAVVCMEKEGVVWSFPIAVSAPTQIISEELCECTTYMLFQKLKAFKF